MPRHAEMVKLYYGIEKNKEYTLQEIGDLYRVSRERVRQIVNKSLRTLKQPAKDSQLVIK
jgi:RNA polymerase primary sigma factor